MCIKDLSLTLTKQFLSHTLFLNQGEWFCCKELMYMTMPSLHVQSRHRLDNLWSLLEYTVANGSQCHPKDGGSKALQTIDILPHHYMMS